MTLERKISVLFTINAFINWIVSIRGIIDPSGFVQAFGGPAPEYEFAFRVWMGLVFMFGCMFWEVSRDVRGKAALIKYNWIEKTITATGVTVGYFTGDATARAMLLIVLTNWAWIPFLFYYDMRLRAALAVEPPPSSA